MGGEMVEYLKLAYERAKSTGHWHMATEQPGIASTWNTMVASTYWDMRLSTACAVTDSQYQNRLIQRDMTRNLPVVARQPHPNPNYAGYRADATAAGRRLAIGG